MPVILRLVLTFCLVLPLMSCTRPPDIIGVDNAEVPVLTVSKATRRKVFIMTTREATDVIGAFYSAERAPDLGLASVVVSVPPTHMPGAIERPKRLPPDPRTDFAVIEPTVYSTENAFISRLNDQLSALPPSQREIIFFVHGYNNTFTDSVLRVAQFVEDTNFNGVPILFSWASAAKATHYVYDLNSVLAARPRFYDAVGIAARSRAKGFNIFAHSMGSLLTLEAIVQSERAGTFDRSGRLKNIMFAAPDIDLDLFKSQVGQLNRNQKNFFVFVSQDDRALGFSKRISGGVTRVGAANAVELSELGVTVIDLSAIEDSESGSHSKFAGSPEVVQLIGKSLKSDNFSQPASLPSLVEVLGGAPIVIDLGG